MKCVCRDKSRKRLIENPLNERPGLADVYNFAKAKHDATGVIRKNSGQPYWVHPSMVADVCLAYGGTDEEIALALLHDTTEDTDTSYEEVAARYGEYVAELLSEITNEPSEVKRLGKENYINHELMELDHSALFVKLCDMYANSLDHPSAGQAERVKRNLEHLIEFRGEELTDKERRLIKAFPLMDEYDLDVSEFEDSYDEYCEDNYLLASREMPKNRIAEKLDCTRDYPRCLKEDVYIASPESLLRFWIIDENDPEYSHGYIESNRKFDFYLLQKNIQKVGYKVTQIKPKYCIYARGIPSRVLIGLNTYIEFAEEDLLKTVRQTTMDLQATLKPVDRNPLKDSTVKGSVFKFKHGLKESTGHKNNDDFSKSPEHLPFERVKELLENPEQLIKYYYQHPENYSCCQCFNVAKDLDNYDEYREFLLGPVQHAIDTVYGITSFSRPDFPLELYRGIVLFDVEPDKDHLGICWSYEREGAEDWVNEISSDDDPNDAPCILTGKTTLDNVDWLMTILLLTDTPEEREIRIWDDTKIDLLDYEVL